MVHGRSRRQGQVTDRVTRPDTEGAARQRPRKRIEANRRVHIGMAGAAMAMERDKRDR